MTPTERTNFIVGVLIVLGFIMFVKVLGLLGG